MKRAVLAGVLGASAATAAYFIFVHDGSQVELPLPRLDDLVVEERSAPPPPPREGNKARLLINGEAAFLERMRLIDEAEESIYIQALIYKADATGNAIADRLIARKRANPELDIRLIVDAYSNIQDVNAQMLYFELMDEGIDVQGYEAFYLHWINEIDLRDWTAGNKRYHEKYWIVDGTKAILGGMNIGDEYARVGDDPLLIWRDQDVFLEGEVVRDVESAFLENFETFTKVKQRWPNPLSTDTYWEAWSKVHPRLRGLVTDSVNKRRTWTRTKHPPWNPVDLERRRVESPLHEKVTVQFVRSRPRAVEKWIERAYIDEIDDAESTVVVANAYFIPSADLVQALTGAARRGVAVTVITNSKATNDIPIINDAGRVYYERLIEAGVAVYEWHAERAGEGTMHGKFAVFDSEVAIIGSYNLDPRSLGLNSEDVVVIDDLRIAGELHTRVMETDLRLADRITPEQAEAWSDPSVLPLVDAVPEVPLPWYDPRFDPDRFELFLMRQAEVHL